MAYEKEIHLQASKDPRRGNVAERLNHLGFAAVQRLEGYRESPCLTEITQ